MEMDIVLLQSKGESAQAGYFQSKLQEKKEETLTGKINNRAAKPRGCCSHKVFIFWFHTSITAAELEPKIRRGMKPSIQINAAKKFFGKK
jgi:hypothetical protein